MCQHTARLLDDGGRRIPGFAVAADLSCTRKSPDAGFFGAA